jgi:TonB family protein
MKTTISAMLLSLIMVSGFTQDLNYDVHGKYKNPVKKEVLNHARSMSDIIPYYPSSWVTNYISSEIEATYNGNTRLASGKNEILTEEQIRILNTVEPGTNLVIKIKYNYKNPVTGVLEESIMNYPATVIPEKEAEYAGGYEQMTEYLKNNAIDKISDKDAAQLEQAAVRFTVNEEGEIGDAQISKTSGNQQIDELLLEAVNNMPNWIAAEDSEGTKVKQEFEFSVQGGSAGC